MNQANPQVMTDLPVSEHLAELRRRLIIIISTLTLGTILAYYFVPGISQLLIRPIAKFNLTLAFFTVTGAFVTRVKLALIAATIVLSPLIFYQIAAFITPGLRTAEKRLIISVLLFLSLAFATGVVFGYYLVIPLTLHFLITFGKSYLTPVLSGERYLSFIAVLEIINGAVFTVPVIIIYLGKMGILQARLLKKGRKYLLGFLLIVEGMMGSVNDFFSLVMLALPLIILYEISLWSVYWLEKKRAKSGE